MGSEEGEEQLETVALEGSPSTNNHEIDPTEVAARAIGSDEGVDGASSDEGDVMSTGRASSVGSAAHSRAPSVPPPTYEESLVAHGAQHALDHGKRLRVRVCEPSRRDDTRSSLGRLGKRYTSYKVEIDTDMLHFKSSSFSVRRRFSDFSLLADRLALSHRGYFVPPRPDKTIIDGSLRNRRGFDQTRADELDRYLRRLAAHPRIRESQELCTFLQASGDLPASREWLSAAPKPPSAHTSSAAQTVRQFGHTIQHQLTSRGIGKSRSSRSARPSDDNSSGQLDVVDATEAITLDDDDVQESHGQGGVSIDFDDSTEHGLESQQDANTSDQGVDNKSRQANREQHDSGAEEDGFHFEERRAHHRELERLVDEASRCAGRLLERQQRIGRVAGDLGLAAFKLARFEDAEAERRGAYSETGAAVSASANDLRTVYNAGGRLSKQTRSAASALAAQLEPLNTFLAEIPAARRAEEDLEHAEVVRDAREDEVYNFRQKVERADERNAMTFRGERSALQRQARARAAHERAQDELKQAKEEAELVRRRVQSEYERAEDERMRSFKAMLHGFARAQAADEDRTAEAWAQMAELIGTAGESADGDDEGDGRKGELNPPPHREDAEMGGKQSAEGNGAKKKPI